MTTEFGDEQYNFNGFLLKKKLVFPFRSRNGGPHGRLAAQNSRRRRLLLTRFRGPPSRWLQRGGGSQCLLSPRF